MTKIMLVEDDNNLREIYEARLAAEGYTIVSAQDGEAALALAAKERPDLVITDVMMPKISGFEMLDILRNTENLRDVKVIMLTALGQAEDNARANALGADRYLVKSQVTLEDIVKATHDLLDDTATDAPGAGVTTEPVDSVDAATPTPATPPVQTVSASPWQVAEPLAVVTAPDDPHTPNTPLPADTSVTPIDIVTPASVPAAVPSVDPVDPVVLPALDLPAPDQFSDVSSDGTFAPASSTPEPVLAPDSAQAQDPATDVATDTVQDSTEVEQRMTPEAAADQSEITDAAPAAQEESAIREQIDQFLDSVPTEEPEAVPTADSTPIGTETTSMQDLVSTEISTDDATGEVAQYHIQPIDDQSDSDYAVDDSTPDMGEMSVHVEPAPAEEPAATPESSQDQPADQSAASPEASPEPTSDPAEPASSPAAVAPTGYPSQTFTMPTNMPIADTGANTGAAAATEVAADQSSGDKIVSDAVNDMIASTMPTSGTGQPVANLPVVDTGAVPSADRQTSDNSQGQPRKKVISPITDGTNRPDIHQLLAAEEAKNAALQAGIVTQQPGAVPAVPQQPSLAPGQAPVLDTANQAWQPLPIQQQPQPDRYGPGIDPNSISL